MFKLSGKNGDGIGALGLRSLPDGNDEIAVVDTVMTGEPQPLRKAGLGGGAYTRHCLEAIALQRGGLWLPETIETSFDLLDRIDGGHVTHTRFETWIYQETPDGVVRQGVKDYSAQPGTALQPYDFPDKSINYEGLLSQLAARYDEELGRASLCSIWVARYAQTLAAFGAGKAHIGQLLSALLARQAVAERQFVANSAKDRRFDAAAYLELISLRYVRALCQIEQAGQSDLQRPDLIELGRTILLLLAAGRLYEAQELGLRSAPLLPADPFIPVVPLIGLAWASGRQDLITNGFKARPVHGPLQGAAAFLTAIRDGDVHSCHAAITDIIDARRFQIASFSDDHVTDFDDDLSWVVPYEGAALLTIARQSNLEPGPITHPAFDLPTAEFPDLQGEPLHHVHLHGLLVRRLQDG